MADNYLEKRYEEVLGKSSKTTKKNLHPSLDTLLIRNRSYRGFDKTHIVVSSQLELIINANTKVASGMNAQRLRFRPIVKGEESKQILSLIKLGSALPDLHLPLEGTEPEAFIIVGATCEENPTIDIDLGISLQTMLLKAVDLGLGGIIVRNFNAEAMQARLSLRLKPIAVLAIGKPCEKIELVEAHEGESLKYYRKNGIHYVPKLTVKELKF